MSYVIYHKDTTLYLRNRITDGTGFATAAAAKGTLTRCVKQGLCKREDYAIEETNKFRNEIEKKEIRHGVVHSAGKEFEVSVNTPWSSGPWSESYFCN
jgi:hypothetical protein